MRIKLYNYWLKTAGLIAGLLVLHPSVAAGSILMQDIIKHPSKVMDDCPEYTCKETNLKLAAQSSNFFEQSNFLGNSVGNTNQNVASSINEGFTIAANEAQTVAPQIVYLNFDAGGNPTFSVSIQGSTLIAGTFNDHIYTPEERDEIQRLIEEDYANFNFVFTQEEPSSGPFTTLRINENDQGNISINLQTGGVSILFGRADSIDFLNFNRSDSAFVDASLWEYLAQDDPTGRDFTNFSGIPITTTLEDAVSLAVVNQTANTAAHELGHILGLRHHDSFGALGQGLPPFMPNPNDFKPAFTGNRNGTETFLHTMASGGSAGLSIRDLANVNRFFSERSAAKLTVNEHLDLTGENLESQDPLGQSLSSVLEEIEVENTILEGVNSAKDIEIRSAIIAGSIDNIDEADRFLFSGQQGEIINIEVVSFSISNRLPNTIVSALTLFQLDEDDNSLIEIDSNIQNFEGLDPLILDYTLPEDGTYIIQITTPDIVFIDSDDDGRNDDQASLDALGARSFRTGNYRAYFSIFDSSLSN